MAENTSSSLENLPEQVVHDPVIEHAGQAWQAAGRRVRSVTPSSLMRLVLVTGALIGIGWLIWATRISLIPFIVGGIIAYVALPVVNWLDRVMPRIVAVLLTLGLFLGALGLFLSMLIPVLIDQVYFVYSSLPTITDVQTYQEQIDDYIVTLPEPVQDVINNAYDRMTTRVRDNMDDYVNELINLTITTLLALFNTVSFILGFLVVPAWLLTVLTEGRKASPAIDRLLPDWLRLDFWAVLRIVDRAFGRFIRGQLLMGIVTALLVYGGLEFLVRLLARPGNLRLQLLLAITAGLTQLIPSIGPFLGVIPAVIIAYSISWQATILVIIM
ncbi:MAG: AI-2E family transporter, partial [Anaerolineae bacterium]|nr:AI-2E family transporter [Anaerolineae bacterium]